MKPIHNYLINALSFDGYEKQPKTPTERIAYFFEIFDEEYGWNTKRVGIQKSLTEYLQGLGGAINIPFYNSDIIDLANWEQEQKGLPPHAEKKHDRILDNYWSYIANHLIQLKNSMKTGVKIMKLELTKEETELLSECVTSTVNKTLSSLNNEYSEDTNRFDVGYNERYVLENLVAEASLLLKITEEVK